MPTPLGRVLIVDDNREVLTAIRLLLKEHVAHVQTATSPSALTTLMRETNFDVILLDMNFTQGVTSGKEGFQWLANIRRMDPHAVVILMTAYGDVSKAVAAMKAGALDFIVKPWQNDKLITTVRAGIKLRHSRAQTPRTKAPIDAPSAPHISSPQDVNFAGMIGTSPAMRRVFDTIQRVAATDANVLILGEHGTGKELVARALHQASQRSAGPFVTVDLGALSTNLFESELFGHVKGAFTGAAADRVGRFEAAANGTLFLDEIGNIPLALQRKLLTVLERREINRVGSMDVRPIDIRLVSATNMPIYEMAKRGELGEAHPAHEGNARFREDLLYRINTFEIALPPLRERRDDIPLLAEHFMHLHGQRYGKAKQGIASSALDRLQRYHWPGNVRELRNTLERAVILSDHALLQPLDFLLSAPLPQSSTPEPEDDTLDLEDLERVTIRKALSKHGGNISRAAEELGLTRRSLYRRIEKYGL